MSDFVLHYDILEGVAKSSNSLGRQADEYANRLTDRIANAITSVTGSSSGYLEDASYYVNQKVSQLQRKAQEFYVFAEQVTILAETATRVDEEVQKLLAENQEEFLSHHESLRIDDWKADILNWLVDIKNKLPFLEVLGNILSAVDTILESFADSIKYWYQCEGGKYILEFVGGIALAALAVTLFVLTFPASGFLAICGVIGAGIAAINAITNVATSFRAAYAACNGDPTWARIYSKQDTLSQVIRETNFNYGTLNSLSYLGADIIDVTEAFCCIAGLAQIGLSIKKLFSKKTFSIFKKGSFKLSNFKTSIKNGFADTKISLENEISHVKVNENNLIGKVNKLDDLADLNKLDDMHINNLDDLAELNILDDIPINKMDDIADLNKLDDIPVNNMDELLTKGDTQADILAKNRMQGKLFEQQEFSNFSKTNSNAVEQVTIKTSSGTKTRVDAIGLDKNGDIVISEFKSSASAPLTPNQNVAFPEIYSSGGTVVGEGKGIFTKGYQIPPKTEVKIIRPKIK
ncbi:MAG: wapA10 [Herbinix sp.]|jgi:hypothetical protein|nr:wapA10 [Herbinix sp.]